MGIAGPWKGWRLSRPQRLWLESSVSERRLRGFPACQAYMEEHCPVRQCRAEVPAVISGPGAPGADGEPDWAQILGDCQVVVGLHPDQATGSVPALAQVFNLRFAVVPCCTFADDFPERKLE